MLAMQTYPDPDTLAADAYAHETRCIAVFRQRAASAIRTGDFPAFFDAAADCARAMNARAAIVDAASNTPREEVPTVAA